MFFTFFFFSLVFTFIQQAFRVVTTMVNPTSLFKNAQKQIKEGFQAARERLSMGGSTFSSSSSLAEHDPSPSVVTRGKKTPPVRNGMQNFCRKGSLLSFGSTFSESDERTGGTSSGKLFPIPQDRVMTESSRNISAYSDDSSPTCIVNSNRTQDSEFDPNEEPRALAQSPSEKRGYDVTAEAVTVERKKNIKLRRNESREA
jgi:hypothetical protein